MTYKYSTTTNKYSVPYKLRVLAELAEGLLTDAQAVDQYVSLNYYGRGIISVHLHKQNCHTTYHSSANR